MQKNLSVKSLAFVVFLTTPFTLHSTDIYHSSDGTIKINANLNPFIIPGDAKLGSTVLIISAPTKQEGIYIVSSCNHTESLLYKKAIGEDKMLSITKLSFPTPCEDATIRIGDNQNIFTDTVVYLPIEPAGRKENMLINTSSSELLTIMRQEIHPVKEKSGSPLTEKLEYIRDLYKNSYAVLMSDIARNILQERDNNTYISPVVGYRLPSKDILIPGARRPYRKDTTDGIHHGWDIMAPYGTPVQALSTGKIIRIVNDWTWAKFSTLKKGNLTKDDEFQNLDIFRGNQIWLQTMDGNVTFYSHLSAISPNLYIGSYVTTGTYLGNVGKSGVPDRNYRDIHLHFEIQQNPFDTTIKNPTYLDIMRWNYVGEDTSKGQIYEKMRQMFKKDSL